MKYYLFFLLLFLCPYVVQAQGEEHSYHPFIEDGKVWRVAHTRTEIIPNDYWTESFYLGEDTIIA